VEVPTEFVEKYERQHYAVIGGKKHSAVKVCGWTKRALLNRGHCYKQRFYGIPCHRCIQMTPSLYWCGFRCLHCWRSIEANLGTTMDGFEFDGPAQILDDAILAQRMLLTGFKGNGKVDAAKWREAQEPKQIAISLAGEPTLYPELGEFIKEARRRGMTTFLVTNGTQPGVLQKLSEEGALPTQLYVSLCAVDEDMCRRVNQPAIPGAWQKLLETLRLFPSLETRRVIRLTLTKGLNMEQPEKYAELIRLADPDWVEAKSYMAVGYSRDRLGPDYMASHNEIRSFAGDIARESGYVLTDEQEESRVALLSRDEEAARKRRITGL